MTNKLILGLSLASAVAADPKDFDPPKDIIPQPSFSKDNDPPPSFPKDNGLLPSFGKDFGPVPEYGKGYQVPVEVPPIPVCKDGSVYDPSVGCAYVDYADPKPDCPHPYKLDKHSGACVTKTYGESTIICPNGSYMEKHKCLSELSAPVNIYCKHSDAILSDEGCIIRSEPVHYPDEFVEPYWNCPKKFKLIDGTCIAEIAADVDIYCEEGWALHGKKCVSMDYVNPLCDKGYSYGAGGCDLVEIAQPVGRCPKHTVEIKGQCMQEITEKPSYVCEKGYDFNGKGKCEARVLIQAVVDSKKGASFELDCKHGQIDPKTGECYQIHYSSPVAVCDKGFEMQKKKCVSFIPVEYEFECPKHYTWSKDGTCIKNGHAKPKCPKGYKLDVKTGLCGAQLSQKPASMCPKGTSSLQGSKKSDCVTLEYAEPIPSCKHGYDLVKGQCIKPGSVKAGKDKIHDAVYECPKGFKLSKSDLTCYSYLEAEPEPICEKGYSMEKKKCIAYHQVAAQAMCPKGYINDGKSNRCMRVSYTRPIFECPKGANDHGKKCFIYQDNDIQLMPVTGKKRI